MASQDALNAGKTALMFYMSYFNAVSRVIGVEKATKFRSSPDEPCMEELVLSST